MERKIGKLFDYNGSTIIAVEADDKYCYCDGCYFEHMDCIELKVDILGFCFADNRKDGKSVTFKKVKYMERKIGEEFEIKIRIRTVESSDGKSCSICALSDVCNADMFIQNISICDPAVRTDGKNIYYELVSYEEQ